MSCVLSEELAPTPLEAVQVMVAKALSLVTLVTLRLLVTLSSDMVSSVELVMSRLTPSSLQSTPSKNQEVVGAGTPVAMHISAPEAPSEKVTVGFWEDKMAASGATEQGEQTWQSYLYPIRNASTYLHRSCVAHIFHILTCTKLGLIAFRFNIPNVQTMLDTSDMCVWPTIGQAHLVLPHSPNTCSSVKVLVIPSSFTAEQV